MHKKKQAFTLTELSIALLVMSTFLVTIIGASRIKQYALMQSIFSEQLQYRNAILDFYKLKNAIPGDFYNAQSELSTIQFTSWGDVTAQQFEQSAVYSGNGDNKISLNVTSLGIKGATVYISEAYQVWSHLAKAGILTNQYSGYCTNANHSSSLCSQVGINLPESMKIPNVHAGYLFYSMNNDADRQAIADLNSVKDRFLIEIASYNAQTNSYKGSEAAVSASLMQAIDMKFDDGRPFGGSIFGFNTGNTTGQCNTGSNSIADIVPTTIAQYQANNVPTCIIIFAVSEL